MFDRVSSRHRAMAFTIWLMHLSTEISLQLRRKRGSDTIFFFKKRSWLFTTDHFQSISLFDVMILTAWPQSETFIVYVSFRDSLVRLSEWATGEEWNQRREECLRTNLLAHNVDLWPHSKLTRRDFAPLVFFLFCVISRRLWMPF